MLVTVDTGGTKTLVAGFQRSGNLVSDPIRFPTPKDPQQYITQLRSTLEDQFGGQEVEALVVAIPGIIKDGVAIWCNNLGWENFDVADALKGVFNEAPILIENDANLAGLAETRMLDQIPVSSLYVTVSTGIGTGMITNGHIDPGLRHSEAGRILLEFQGEIREWESFASGKAIYKEFEQYGRDISDSNTWQQIAERISLGFLVVIPIIQPDIVIIGGSMGAYFDRFGAPLKDILEHQLPSHIPCPPFKQAEHPERAVIYGCYYYALDYLADQ